MLGPRHGSPLKHLSVYCHDSRNVSDVFDGRVRFFYLGQLNDPVHVPTSVRHVVQGLFARPVTTLVMCCGRALFTVHAAGGSSSVVVELEVLDVPENRHTDFWTWRHRTWRGSDDGNESGILGLTWTQEK